MVGRQVDARASHRPRARERAAGVGGDRQRTLGRERGAEPTGDARSRGRRGWQDPLGRFAANGVARELALSECWDDASDEVRQAEVALSRDPERRLAFEGTRALGEALAGRPLDALRVAAGVRRAAQVADMTIMRAELAVAEALAHRELGDRPRAMAELAALADAPAETMLFCRVLAMCRARPGPSRRSATSTTARHVFGQAEALVEDGVARRRRAGLADPSRDGARPGRGRPRRGACAGPIRSTTRSGVASATARVHLACGDRPAAVAALDRGDPALRPPRSRPGAPHGACSRRSRRGDEARRPRPSSWPRPTASCRPWRQRAPRSSTSSSRRRGGPRRSGSTACGGPRRRHRTVGAPAGPELIEPLTERERDVLRFLPSRLTVREIADELYVSVNTLEVPPAGHLPQARCELPRRSRRDRPHDDEAPPVAAVGADERRSTRAGVGRTRWATTTMAGKRNDV